MDSRHITEKIKTAMLPLSQSTVVLSFFTLAKGSVPQYDNHCVLKKSLKKYINHNFKTYELLSVNWEEEGELISEVVC